MKFMSIDVATLIDKYVGESEKSVKAIFDYARANAPMIMFFDEVDSVAAKGVGEDAKTLRSALLTNIEGARTKPSAVWTICATNKRPNELDAAATRPGRLGDKVLFIGPPDLNDKAQLVRLFTKGKWKGCGKTLKEKELASVFAADHTGAVIKTKIQEANGEWIENLKGHHGRDYVRKTPAGSTRLQMPEQFLIDFVKKEMGESSLLSLKTPSKRKTHSTTRQASAQQRLLSRPPRREEAR